MRWDDAEEAARLAAAVRPARAVPRARRRHAEAVGRRGSARQPPAPVEPDGDAPVQPDHHRRRRRRTGRMIDATLDRVGAASARGLDRLQLLLDGRPCARGSGAAKRRSATWTSTPRPSSCATASTSTAIRRGRASPASPTGRSRWRATSWPCNAVHEMLLQSWSPTPGKRDTEVIRIFPAMPWRWHRGPVRRPADRGRASCVGHAREQRHDVVLADRRTRRSGANPRQLRRADPRVECLGREQVRRRLRRRSP